MNVSVLCICTNTFIQLHIHRARSFLEAGFRPCIPCFVWFVPLTIRKYFLICTHSSEPGLISAGFQWTGSTPTGFRKAFRAVYVHIHIYTCIHTYAFISTLYIHKNTYIQLHIHICTYIYIYMYTNVYSIQTNAPASCIRTNTYK